MPIKITISVQYDAVKTGINLMTSEETAAEMETPQGGSSEKSVNLYQTTRRSLRRQDSRRSCMHQ